MRDYRYKRFLVGTSTGSTVGNSQYAKLEVSGNTSSATGAGAFVIKAGTSTATQTNGNTLGRLIFSTLDGGDYAYIQASIDGSMGSSDFPGRMMFFTCPDNSGTAIERMRIDSSGRVLIGTTSPSPANSYSNNLVVSEASGDGGISIHGNNSNSNYASLYLGDAGAASRAFFEAQLGSGTSTNFTIGAQGVTRFTNNGAERMRIDSSGNIGMGITPQCTTGNILNLDDAYFMVLAMVEAADQIFRLELLLEIIRFQMWFWFR